MADMMIENKVKRVWTTNFDALTETAINIINPQQELLICSSTNSDSIRNFNPTYPSVCKLHGDFRYDNLQNTEDELQKLESTLQEHWPHCLTNRGMIVIGYSGNDESIMILDILCKRTLSSSFKYLQLSKVKESIHSILLLISPKKMVLHAIFSLLLAR